MSDQRANRTSDEPSAETDRSDSQHQAEKLELENKMLRGVLDSMADNISIKDLKGRYIFDNSAHCRFLGATKTSEVVGKTVFDFLPPDIAAKFYAEDLQVLQSGEPLVRCVDSSVDSAGNRVWMSVTKMPLRDDDGRLLGLVSATHDITARKDAEEQLAQYAEKLREKNAQLEEDLETARELQNALLPQQYPRFPSSSEQENSALQFHHFFRSCSGVAGDFFHVCQISDSVDGLFISDVMGHGVRAALVAAMLRTLVEDSRAYATEPSRFLQELNRGISEILKHTHLPIFVSACYLVVDVARGRLRYANAGHPAPLWVRRTRRSVEPLPRPESKFSPVLGIFADAEYQGLSCELCAGDTVLLFTDGLFELQGDDSQFFDQTGLLKCVRQRVDLGAGELCRQLVEEVQQFAAEKDFADDVCLIAMDVDHLMESPREPEFLRPSRISRP
jgi:sigma-B regulation protein RsbU (phosphoserine phosphatase)